MEPSKMLKLLGLTVLVYIGTVLYLHFGRDEGWGSALLIGLIVTPFSVAMMKFRDWYMERAARAGRRWRESRG
ncbi:hypothetical protein [Streptomyces cremeus]|uniref:Uncharacterized protein n=1 Tax=Streptomyces cremeus TaxID=66881 RepID=A0ABV5PFE2_STRCM